MTMTKQMIETHPNPVTVDHDILAACIDECFGCAQVCTSCSDACLAEKMVEMQLKCIRLCDDCSDICDATGRVLSRFGEFDKKLVTALLEACATACEVCGAECNHHADSMKMEHCRISAESCERCAKACRTLIPLI